MSGSMSPWLRLSGLDLLVRLSELALSFVCNNSQRPESQNKLQRRVDLVYPPEESSLAFILETLSSPEVALRRAATWVDVPLQSHTDHSFQDQEPQTHVHIHTCLLGT